MGLRTKIIQKIVHINEAIFFYPKLKRFYKKNLPAGQITIIDVGANKGQSVDFFLELYPNAKINSFEPNNRLFLSLQQKYRENANIVLHNVGVSNIKGQLEFHENILDETSTFEKVNPDSKYLERKAKVLGVSKEAIFIDNYKVDVIRLSDFLENHKGKFFNVLKIDVEGHELQCLEGLFAGLGKTPIDFIQLEDHHDDMFIHNEQDGQIENLLRNNGFSKVAEIKHGFGDFTEVIYRNTFINET
jgi:FkbM family methyltransferase